MTVEKVTGIKLEVDGMPELHTLGENTLDSLQAIVGGYVDAVRLPNDIIMWVNDDGLYTEQPNFTIAGYQVIHGNVFFSSSDAEGETTSLTTEQLSYLRKSYNFMVRMYRF